MCGFNIFDNFAYKTAWNKHQFSFLTKWKQKFEAYYFLQFWDLQILLMNLLILHLQNFFQTLQVLLDVFIWFQSILATADNVSQNHYQSLKTMNKALSYTATVTKAVNKMSCAVWCSSYHYLLICAPAQSFFKTLGSVSEATILKRQRVHLILVTRQILTC